MRRVESGEEIPKGVPQGEAREAKRELQRWTLLEAAHELGSERHLTGERGIDRCHDSLAVVWEASCHRDVVRRMVGTEDGVRRAGLVNDGAKLTEERGYAR